MFVQVGRPFLLERGPFFVGWAVACVIAWQLPRNCQAIISQKTHKHQHTTLFRSPPPKLFNPKNNFSFSLTDLSSTFCIFHPKPPLYHFLTKLPGNCLAIPRQSPRNCHPRATLLHTPSQTPAPHQPPILLHTRHFWYDNSIAQGSK